MRIHGLTTVVQRTARATVGLLAMAAPLCLVACDDLLTVENEQNILDEDLNTPLAVDAVVNGVAGDLSWAYTYIAYMSAQLADELVHTGSDTGIRRPSEGDTRSVHTWAGRTYDRGVTVAFTADDALRRFGEVLGADAASHPAVARAHIYAGFSYLILADNMCQVTFDGGPPIAPEDVYPMAEQHFTDAIAIAQAADRDDLRLQAVAGRARARVSHGDWEGATTDAQQIPHDFEYVAAYSTNSTRENNTLAQQTRREFRKETGVRSHFYEDAVRQADPRTPFTTFDFAESGADGVSVFVQQEKFPSLASNMQLSSWQEARLIEAEAELNLGQVARAVELIDEVRAAAALPAYDGPTTNDAVFEQLIYERSAELWLEAQRLRDLRRTDDPFVQDRDSCYPPSITERSSNPNLGG